MIIDVAAFVGAWPSHPVHGRIDTVVESLKAVGVDRVMCSPLDGVWCRNPHLYNGLLYETCSEHEDLLAVPIIDPTLATWPAEIGEAVRSGVSAIRVLPNYHSYALAMSTVLCGMRSSMQGWW